VFIFLPSVPTKQIEIQSGDKFPIGGIFQKIFRFDFPKIYLLEIFSKKQTLEVMYLVSMHLYTY